jgi:hypothetical protein
LIQRVNTYSFFNAKKIMLDLYNSLRYNDGRKTTKGDSMVVYNETSQTYDVIWKGMVISSTWSKENAEALVQELQEG